MDQRLRVTAGSEKGLSWELPETGILNIGRIRQHNEICIHDPKMSRVHCEVAVADGRVVVTDLDSETGTFLNGQRITQHQMVHGDVLRVGDTELSLQSLSSSHGTAAAGAGRGGPHAEAPAVGAGPRGSNADAPILKAPADTDGDFPVLGARAPGSTADLPALETVHGKPRPDGPAAGGSTAGGAKDLRTLSGTTLGPFEIGPVLGAGHCGVAFRARDTREDRVVALKVLHADFPKAETEMQNFTQAMKGVMGHRHPNLTTILGIGRGGGHVWVAREHVDGESLAQTLERSNPERLPDWTDAFRVAVHVARALHFAHGRHLLHRNVTPRNVLFRSTDHLVKLTDLGLAKALAGSALRQAVMRAKVQAELPFLPPEQTQPSPNLDPRSDIYALGATVYAVLTGRPPFTAKTSAELVAMVRETEPPEPRQWQPSMPEAFQGVVMRMLAKRPEERYQTAADVLGALARIYPDPA